MRAVILAAGKGARLRGAAGDIPKCLAQVGGMSLIERQIIALRACGIEDIIAVIGFCGESVRRVCGSDIEYIENPIFFRTSSLYSLWLARYRLEEGFVVLNSDVLIHPQLITDLMTSRYEDALLVAYKDETTPPFGDEEMKVIVRSGLVVDISKSISPDAADGENVGIVKFGRTGAALLNRHVGHLISKGSQRAWAPRAFREFAKVRPLHAIGTRGLPWIEIDFPADYDRALNEILPEIGEADAAFDETLSLAIAAIGERI